ncbi:DNA topoisomerase IB [Prosthecomicrobium sp. N25]
MPDAPDLIFSSDEFPGIRRRRAGKGFSYIGPDGLTIRDRETLARIRKLAIPPAWTDVWISADPRGHMQATGRDAKGRKQYRYHPDFRAAREAAKYEHLTAFARALPLIRRRVAEDMGRRGLPREKVLAAIVHLLENTLIRIGNAEYAKENKSYGLTTLRDRHVAVEGSEMRFAFKGKSGKTWKLQLKDRRAARVVKQCQDLPGQHLFQYVDENGERQAVKSEDVNRYLKEITGQDITAKDFRTWGGTVLAAVTLHEYQKIDNHVLSKKNVKTAIEQVAARLGNTPTICRKCYVHPEVVASYLDGALALEVKEEIEAELRDGLDRLTTEEVAVMGLLRARLEREAA